MSYLQIHGADEIAYFGGCAGGLTAFAWSDISWQAIGWHEKAMAGFQRDEEVAAVISSHTIQDGTYLLPMGPRKRRWTG